MLDPALASFLAAAVRAGKSIVVSGPQGVGQDHPGPRAVRRAGPVGADRHPGDRAGAAPAQATGRHHRHGAPSRPGPAPGNAPRTAGRPGRSPWTSWSRASLRFNLSRFIVGEVRGPEVLGHVQGDAVRRRVHVDHPRALAPAPRSSGWSTCAMEAGPHVTDEYAYRQVAAHINLIVQIDMRTTGPHRPAHAHPVRRRGDRRGTRGEQPPGHHLPVGAGPGHRPRPVPGTLPARLGRRARRVRVRPRPVPGATDDRPGDGRAGSASASGWSSSATPCWSPPTAPPAPPTARRADPRRGSRGPVAVRLGVGAALGLLGLLVTGWPVALLVGPLAGARAAAAAGPPGQRHRDPAAGGAAGMDPVAGRGAHRRHRPGAGHHHHRPLRPGRDPPPGHRPGRPAARPHPHRRRAAPVRRRPGRPHRGPDRRRPCSWAPRGAGRAWPRCWRTWPPRSPTRSRIRRAVEADQAKVRTTTRMITAVTLLMMGGLFVTGTYIAPYGTPLGPGRARGAAHRLRRSPGWLQRHRRRQPHRPG